MAEQFLKIGELARRGGKTVRSLRLYEEVGLLTPACRSAGGFRLYDGENLERIKFIDHLQRLGYSLAGIQQMVDEWRLRPTATEAMTALRCVYEEKLGETRRQIAELEALERELVESVEYIDAGCRRCNSKAAADAACAKCERLQRDDNQHLVLLRGLSRK